MKPLAGWVVASALITASLPIAQAAESNPAIVHRQAIYKLLGGHMTGLQSILALNYQAPEGGDTQKEILFHAEGLAESIKHFGNAYPPGSDKGETKAKADIWKNMDKFKEKGKASREAIQNLLTAANSGNREATLAAFKDVGKACKACHEDFRED